MNQLYGFQKRQAADLVFSTPQFYKTIANRYILVIVFDRTSVRYIQAGLSEQNNIRTYVWL